MRYPAFRNLQEEKEDRAHCNKEQYPQSKRVRAKSAATDDSGLLVLVVSCFGAPNDGHGDRMKRVFKALNPKSPLKFPLVV